MLQNVYINLPYVMAVRTDGIDKMKKLCDYQSMYTLFSPMYNFYITDVVVCEYIEWSNRLLLLLELILL